MAQELVTLILWDKLGRLICPHRSGYSLRGQDWMRRRRRASLLICSEVRRVSAAYLHAIDFSHVSFEVGGFDVRTLDVCLTCSGDIVLS